MTRYRIPLENGSAYQTFTANLGGRNIEFRLHWQTLYGYFLVGIYENGEPITLGRGLNPGIDLLGGLNQDIGSLTLEGRQPTIRNLGIENRLIWDDGQ